MIKKALQPICSNLASLSLLWVILSQNLPWNLRSAQFFWSFKLVRYLKKTNSMSKITAKSFSLKTMSSFPNANWWLSWIFWQPSWMRALTKLFEQLLQACRVLVLVMKFWHQSFACYSLWKKTQQTKEFLFGLCFLCGALVFHSLKRIPFFAQQMIKFDLSSLSLGWNKSFHRKL